jgi:2-polyprenyl-3-methyl-5-hydroxy-6-metoxy-1,4-benzoquinol methylase/glycosyltransferase involved in cell wall biosynthesis
MEQDKNMEIGNFKTFCVSRDMNMNPKSADAALLRLVGRNKRVLELGCAAGHMSRAMREQECRVVGIEINAEAANLASAFCEKVIVGDLDYMNFPQELGSDRFDVVLAADVLEHLKDPAWVLQKVSKFLEPGGYLVTSIPNVAHLSVRLALFAGSFPYSQSGLLDKTHLRFFTRETAESLLDEAGFAITDFQRVENKPDEPKVPVLAEEITPAVLEALCRDFSTENWARVKNSIPPALLESLCRDPEAWTYQFIFVGYPLSQPGLACIQQRLKQLADEADNARKDSVKLASQLEAVKDLFDSSQKELSERNQYTIPELELQVHHLGERAAAAQSKNVEIQSHLNVLLEVSDSLREEGRRSQELNAELGRRIESLLEEDARKQSRIQELSRLCDTSQRNADEAGRQIELLQQEVSRKEKRIEDLAHSNETGQLEVSGLRRELEEQKQRIAGLTAQVQALLTREKDLREMLLDAHDQLLRRDEEIAATLAASLPRNPAPAPTPSPLPAAPAPAPPSHPAIGAFAPQTLPGKYLQYQQLLQRIRELVRDSGVKSNKILVISKGDEQLLRLDASTGSHFPQDVDGAYAGYHPADSESAIKHLEELRGRGAQFLLIPQTSLWWLEHYAAFTDHLNRHFGCVINQPDVCLLFDLAGNQHVSTTTKQTAKTPESTANVNRTPELRAFGVNVCGHIRSEKGVGEAVRGQIRALTAANVPIMTNDYYDNSGVNLDDEFTQFADENPYAVNLLSVNADSLKYLVESKPQEYFRNHYNIGCWWWETPVFPREWWDRFQHLDEIWVGSDFVLDAVSRISPIPVVKVLVPVADRFSLNGFSRAHFGLSADTFIFLFVFDFMSVTERKNPFGLVKAFHKAFGKRQDVQLILKCAHSERHPDEMAELKQTCKHANIKIIDAVLSRNETTSLMKVADCYVSLHRSEGFGLTMAEAMILEKPVIATPFSGNMEFMTPSNSYFVKYRRIAIDKDYGPYRGGYWADPDLDHAAELMEHVFKNREEAVQVGKRARRDILQLFNEKRIGTLMRDRLIRIAEMGKIAAPIIDYPDEAEADRSGNGFYHDLVERIRQTVDKTIPSDSRVLVVSKGDDELLQFGKRTAFHFPQTAEGKYAGYHPANGTDAIQQIERLKDQGCNYLLLPQTSFWWLDYYKELQSHLQNEHRKVWSDSDCIIYQLSPKSTGLVQRIRERILPKNGAH